jgi:hypothetical protein
MRRLKGEAAPVSRDCWHGTQPYAADAEAARARFRLTPCSADIPIESDDGIKCPRRPLRTRAARKAVSSRAELDGAM